MASTRSLGKKENVKVITCDSEPAALAGESKYSSHYIQCPSPKSAPEAFVEWVKNAIAQYKITCLFPVTEISSRTLLAHRAEFHCLLPFASLETVLQLSDKISLMKLADSIGVPIPQTQYYNNSSELNFDDITYPCVIKPSLSRVLKDKQWVETQVSVAKNKEALAKILAKHKYIEHSPFMLQDFIEGHGAGIFTYYQKGKSKAFFAHKRLREKPPQGGVSVLSESVSVDPQMKQYAEKLLNHVSWHGAAMIEYRVSANGTPFLMEINTRLWGSLQLAIDSGVDFPSLLLDGELGVEVHDIEHFKQGQQLRWLLGDLDNLYLTWKSKDYSFVKKLIHTLKFMLPKFIHRKHEVNRFDDMKPFWFELKHYFH
ncbi:ATP-grasp domain-containing protein [Alteromonas facilis]|uniref:carboxylate--amine ligase n=1 Tax=Alteromonas facilis TaxID=2048004 RepID=UPI0013D9C58A|nr:ATP-grasp domain-containing protein [Alteromonas facilis]